MNHMQDENGNWVEATPTPVQGPVAKFEFYLRDKGFKWLPNILARFDERNLH